MIQMAMIEGGDSAFYLTGQYIQLALIMQILIGVPIFVTWVFVMEFVVGWLLSYSSPNIAELAARYAKVVVIDYLIRACGRTFMIPYLMDGPAPFDRIIEVVGNILTILAIIVVLKVEQGMEERTTLVTVAWIQVVSSIAKTTTKVAFVILKRWFYPYQDGFFGSFTLLVSRPLERRA
jgi:Na+-driven multidrug efflux pump